MDPESGEPLPQGSTSQDPSALKVLLAAVWARLHAILLTMKPGREVGVENRFYFDEVEKVWKLQGGETEQERLEAEAIRHHTGRGMSSGFAPPTTACDATRGADAAALASLPPPPTGGPITQSIHAGSAASMQQFSGLSHPVYAPQGFGVDTAAGAPPQAGAARPQPGAAPQALSSPFGQAPPAATNPFAAVGQQPAAGPAALSSPFGAAAAQSSAVAGAPAGAPQALASPFGAAPAAGGPAVAQTPFPEAAAAPGDAAI